jgi:hypothetical protein
VSKYGGTTAAAAVVTFAVMVAVIGFVSTWPVMLVLGALHSSEGLGFVPALGFWQTLGSLFIIAAVGNAFHGAAKVNDARGGKNGS